MAVFGFMVIALVRVVQKICSKNSSKLVNGRMKFLEYGAFYMFMSAVFAFVYLCFQGFWGFNGSVIVFSLLSALLFAVDLYTSIEALKGTSLVVCNIFAMGGVIVPCIAGNFNGFIGDIIGIEMENQIMQWHHYLGLAAFLLSVYLISAKKSEGKKEEKAFSTKTLVMLLLNFLANGLVMWVQNTFAALPKGEGNVAMFSALTFFFNAVFYVICIVVLLLVNGKGKAEPPRMPNRLEKLEKSLYLNGFLLAIALFVMNTLVTLMAQMQLVPTVVLFPVSSAITILVTCIIGACVYKEKLTVKNIIGVVLCLASIITLNL